MKQLEIQFFFPLTEQIPLDLDYTKSVEFDALKRITSITDSVIYTSSIGCTNVSAVSIRTDHIDWDNSTRLGNWEIENSKRKPGILQKFFVEKIFGMKWIGK